MTDSGTPGALDQGTAPRRVDKPWGNELIWVLTDRYCGKIITIDAGRRLSLQRHEMKDEAVYILAGKLRLHLEDETGTMQQIDLGPGGTRRVPVGRKHRFEALERTELVEISTPELDDVERLEDDFGREGTSAP
jgi:mannose-6-phosphate isomerase